LDVGFALETTIAVWRAWRRERERARERERVRERP